MREHAIHAFSNNSTHQQIITQQHGRVILPPPIIRNQAPPVVSRRCPAFLITLHADKQLHRTVTKIIRRIELCALRRDGPQPEGCRLQVLLIGIGNLSKVIEPFFLVCALEVLLEEFTADTAFI
ncbi:hypothetical protein D3C87_1250790 [compost metagenome]